MGNPRRKWAEENLIGINSQPIKLFMRRVVKAQNMIEVVGGLKGNENLSTPSADHSKERIHGIRCKISDRTTLQSRRQGA